MTNNIEEQSMHKHIKSLLLGLAVAPVLAVCTPALAQSATLEVMNPRGEIPPPPFHAPSPRVTDLAGKTVGIYWIGKAGGDNFWDGVEEVLNERFPNTKTVRYEGPFDLGEKRAQEIAREVDTIFYGVGD
jgi:hypothetical protein